ncbi:MULTISPECIES: hypothetical protein [Bacillaceae]|uniref:Phosphatidylinositol kinase n=1 Tax=Oceanobacillus caeni TaxID=405946 RepID=A0ABR5MNM4_9BACI|nr:MULTISPECIES: hypothetical protein [Bacillaceae]KPH79166.1 hypothetical protein AFL42_00155 [Oceanobacillus caeni]MED4476296.1 hypothetical protein [Oceanobacillus caeni]
MKHKHIYDLCKQHMHSYVLVETNDNQKFDGILTGLDEEYAYFAIPIEQGNMGQMADYPHHQHQHQPGMMGNMQGYSTHPGMMNEHTHGNFRNNSHEQMYGEQEEMRQFGYYGYGFPGYGYPYPRRRFSRLVLPLAALVALTALPWY